MTPHLVDNDIIAFELLDDAMYYVNNFLNNKKFSMQKVHLYHINLILKNSKHNNGVIIKKHNPNFIYCFFTYVFKKYLF